MSFPACPPPACPPLQFRFVPVEGGVLEYGVPSTLSLDSNLLDATLKLRVDTSGAGYALYWKETNGVFTVAGSYLPPARELALIKQEPRNATVRREALLCPMGAATL